jgi:RHS repeat-associated protein
MMHLKGIFTLAAALASSGALAAGLLAGPPGAPLVSVDDVNPGTRVERDLCLSVSVGPGAASECGDLRLAHALPTVRTLNQARAPVLLFNSQHASPHPVVAAHVTLPSGTAGLSRVVAILKVNGTPRGQGVWRGSTWPGAGPVRIAVGYDAAGDPTGPYRYTLEVRAQYGTTTTTQTARGELVVVNRRESPFGAGWWLAGLEQLVMDPTGHPLLWVGGDGSTRRYTVSPADTSVWGAPSLDRPDTLKRAGTGWERILPGGVRVRFDAAGRHVYTRSRFGHQTAFRYDAAGRVDSVSVPPAGTGRGFVFRYATSGFLQRAESPGVGTAPRVTTLHHTGARVDSVGDPDTTFVRFAYADAARPLVPTARRNRLGIRTEFQFDAAGRIARAHLAPGSPDSAVTRLRAMETLGLATATGGGAVDTARAYALVDGPRSNVGDSTRMWLDRWGAPRRIVDAGGRETVLERGDARLPALVTRIHHPRAADGRRRVVDAWYNALGGVDSTTDWSTSRVKNGVLTYATTRYAYEDPLSPEYPTRTTLPEGEVTRTGYQPNGHPAWTQTGEDTLRRASFTYNALGLVETVKYPRGSGQATAPVDSFKYDTRGNLTATVSPLGQRTTMELDALGRATVTRTPVREGEIRIDSVTYDSNGRPLRSVAAGPPLYASETPAQSVVVLNFYDREGRLLDVTRRSVPDVARIGDLVTMYEYDAAGRRIIEREQSLGSERTYYNAAGLADSVRTRRGHVTRMEYDALGRLRRRITPEVRHAPQRQIFQWLNHAEAYGTHTIAEWTYPFSTLTQEADGSFLIRADTAVFDYDAAGNLVRADNGDAWVRRDYNLNGSLRADSSYIRTWTDIAAGGSFTQHAYGQELEYDLNGRRTLLRHSENLAPRNGVDGTLYRDQRYAYDPVTGSLASTRDVLGNEFRFTYDAAGAPDSIIRPGGTTERFLYDLEGRIQTRTVQGTNYSSGISPYTILDYTLQYWKDGKLATMLNGGQVGIRGITLDYSGLGILVRSETRTTGSGQIGAAGGEYFKTDALGHWVERSSDAQAVPTISTYFRGTDRLDTSRPPLDVGFEQAVSAPVDQSRYDDAGNLEWFKHDDPYLGNFSLTRNFYAADNTLRAVDRRSCHIKTYVTHHDWETWTPFCEAADKNSQASTFEWYRYDALGRRVLVRTRRDHTTTCTTSRCSSSIQRTVWDGDQVLHEIRADGAGSNNSMLENDAAAAPAYGRVAYAHGPGIDQPLSVVRIGYVPPSSIGAEADYQFNRWGGPWAVIPLTDYRGTPITGTVANGRRLPCETSSTCALVEWPTTYRAYYSERAPASQQTWFGSLVQNSSDGSGLMYRRNRYYNPATGLFTQPDPIGLAGGLNTYGFADGDPVTYSDPYGLFGCEKGDPVCQSVGYRVLTYLGVREQTARRIMEPAVLGSGMVSGGATFGASRALTRSAATGAKPTVEVPEIIYREGKPNPGNLRTRPGEDAVSFRGSLSNPVPGGARPVLRPGEPYFGIQTSRLPPGSVIPDNIPPGHVSVKGVAPEVLQDAVSVRGKFPN